MLKFILFNCLIYSSLFSLTNFVLISLPGSGKGTFCQYMTKKYGYVQICPGDIFRKEIELGTDCGKLIQPIVERGDYVDEFITCSLIEKNVTEALKQNRNFIIDGFPRSLYSFEFLLNLLKKNNLESNICFLQFLISDNSCIERIINRTVCTNCFMVYNKLLSDHKNHKICNNCGFNLTIRQADTPEIALKRVEYFHENIEPLIQLAFKDYTTKKINSEQSISNLENIYDELLTN